MQNTIEALRDAVSQAKSIVFFGGAGVSTESGLPDFRGANGLYKQQYKYPPDKIFSSIFFKAHPDEFYSFYRERILSYDVKPNAAHIKLAELEQQGKLKAVLTQNIDGLHQAAGSKKVLELHGSMRKNYCTRCRKSYDLEFIKAAEGVPHCTLCGGIVRPGVTLFGEPLNKSLLNRAVRSIRSADMLIVGGTSLAVQPAVGLVHEFKGKPLVLINKGSSPVESQADIVLHESIGEVFSAL